MNPSPPRRSLSRILLVVFAASLAGSARAQDAPVPPPAKCKIVVLNLVGRGLPAQDAEIPLILTESLAGEVGAVSGCDVVSQGDIVAMIDFEQQKAVCTDGSDSCLAEVGQALGAERVIAGTIAKLGGDFILSVRLMNVRKGAVEARAEEPVSMGAEQLRVAVRNVGRRLFGAKDLSAEAGGNGPTGAGLPGLFWAGAAVGTLGLVAVAVGGGLAFAADARLGDAQETKKDAVQDEGLVALGIAGLGGALALTGGVLAAVAFME